MEPANVSPHSGCRRRRTRDFEKGKLINFVRTGISVIDLQANVPKTHKIHLHCFNNDWFTCKKWLAEYPNLKIGLTPLITKPHITYLHKVVREVPLDRILLETDAPYFHPRLV